MYMLQNKSIGKEKQWKTMEMSFVFRCLAMLSESGSPESGAPSSAWMLNTKRTKMDKKQSILFFNSARRRGIIHGKKINIL